MNNRKIKEKENNQESVGFKGSQPIQPKFIPNWSSVVKFDRIVVNVSGIFFPYNSDCVYDVLPKVCKQLKFKVQKDKQNAEWDLWWTDWHVVPQTLMKMQHHQKINHFPGMHVLSRKNLMAKNLMKMRKKSPQEYNFFPLTWNLPLDFNEFKAYYDTKPKGKARTYIVKPESMSQGKGIFLTRKIEDIDRNQHCVVQRYISKPYLIDGLKFDLRIYVLVASVDPLSVYIYHEGLARFCTEPYIMPNKDNMEDVCMHLTNYAINKDSDKFVFNSDQKDMSKGHKRSLTCLFSTLQQNGLDVPALKKRIHQIIVKTLISGLSHLRFQYRSCQSENYRSDMCFQLLGFDVILNDAGEPNLLQINYTPSFSTDTPLDLTIKKNLIKDTMTLMQLDKEIKQRLVKERIQVKNQRMLTGKKEKLTPEEKQLRRAQALKEKKAWTDEHLGGFQRIYPLDENDPQQAIYEDLIKYETQYENGTTRKPKKQTPPNQPTISSTPSHMKRRESQKIAKLPQISGSKQNPFRKFSASKLGSQKRMVELSKTSGIASSDKILKDSSDLSSSQTDSIRRPLRSQHHADHKKTFEDTQSAIQQNSQKFIKKMFLREIYPKKKVQQRETLVPKSIQFQGNKYDGLSEGYILGRGLTKADE